MRQGTHPGACKMPHIVQAATGNIRHRLWTLYWLARFSCKPKLVGYRYDDPVLSGSKIVELGVGDGDSTRALLCAVEDLDNSSVLWSYDIEPSREAHVRERTRLIGVPVPMATWAFNCLSSITAGKQWPGDDVDMVFVDTDHTLETTRQEIAAWSPHVRVGGCMAFHDYWLTTVGCNGVKPAVDEFYGEHCDSWVLECHDAGPDGDTGFAILWKTK